MDKKDFMYYLEKLQRLHLKQIDLTFAISPIITNDHVAVEDKKKLFESVTEIEDEMGKIIDWMTDDLKHEIR